MICAFAVAVFVFLTASPAFAANDTPPDAFRGIKWDSRLPSIPRLQKTVLKGCVTVLEQQNFTDTPPCSHVHIDTDDMDLFTQRRNAAPLFGVPVSEQLLSWSYKKFWSGEAFIHNYKDTDLATLRAALIRQYGVPTIEDTEQHRTEWDWPNDKLMIRLTFDPVPKPAFAGDSTPPQTSLSLLFTRTE
jgi:hypothetical protein